MKYPKNLQKRNKITKQPQIPHFDTLILVFKVQFEEIKKKFDDTRPISYINEKDKVKEKTSVLSRIAVKWNEETILISIFKEGIKLLSEKIKRMVPDIDLHKLHQNIANHEYGHILSAKTVYDLFPKEARNYGLMELTQEKLLPMHHSPLEDQLKQVSIDRLISCFREFLANYYVKEKIESSIPVDSLKSKYANIRDVTNLIEQKGKFSLYNPLPSENRMEKGYDRFFLILRTSDEFFIFDKWDEFCSYFNGKGIEASLKLMKHINQFFEKIILMNEDDIDSMKNDVIELARILDQMNFIQLIQGNRFEKVNKEILRKFIGYLRDKES